MRVLRWMMKARMFSSTQTTDDVYIGFRRLIEGLSVNDMYYAIVNMPVFKDSYTLDVHTDRDASPEKRYTVSIIRLSRRKNGITMNVRGSSFEEAMMNAIVVLDLLGFPVVEIIRKLKDK